MRSPPHKRGLFVDHLVEEDTHRPNIHPIALILPKQYFWRHVLQSAAERESGGARHLNGAPSEITDFDIVVVVQQQIFRLDVAVDDLAFVDVLEGVDSLREKSMHELGS